MTALPFFIGLATGLLSGCGIGGGSLLLLYLTGVRHLPPRQAAGINLLYFSGCAPAALIGHIRQKQVVWSAALWCAAAGIAAAIPTALLTEQLSVSLLRRCFGVLSLYIGYKELCTHKDR